MYFDANRQALNGREARFHFLMNNNSSTIVNRNKDWSKDGFILAQQSIFYTGSSIYLDTRKHLEDFQELY